MAARTFKTLKDDSNSSAKFFRSLPFNLIQHEAMTTKTSLIKGLE